VNLGDDVMYYLKWLGSTFLWMLSSDDLELNDVLFVSSLNKNRLLVSCMVNHQCKVVLKG
jgi:hypothetical protein